MQNPKRNRTRSVRLLVARLGLLGLLATGCVPDALRPYGTLLGAAGSAGLSTAGGWTDSEPAITTSFADAVTEVPALDTFDPADPRPAGLLQRGANGEFTLQPGFYAYDAQSYCLHAGTHGPSRGDGYLLAPLRGPLADPIRKLLQRSVARPDIEQHDIQILIWAILAHTNIGDMEARSRQVAGQLLTPDEIFQLNGGALGILPAAVLEQMTARLPEGLRAVFEAEATLRERLTAGAATYEELEAIAVLAGSAPPESLAREVPAGRWSFHPAGLFVRYFPSGYSRTTHQIYTPEPFTIERDGQGRITAVEDWSYDRLELHYAAAATPLANGTLASTFRTLRFHDRTMHRPEIVASVASECKDEGWTLHGLVPDTAWAGGTTLAYPPNAPARFAQTRAQLQDVARLQQALGVRADTSSPASRDRIDLGHLVLAIAALRAQAPDGAPSLSAAQDLLLRAWQSAVCSSLGACPAPPAGEIHGASSAGPLAKQATPGAGTSRLPGGGGGSYDPSGDTATPANSNSQRLAQSGRPAEPADQADCDAARRDVADAEAARAKYEDPDRLRQAADMTGDEYQAMLFGSCQGCESPMGVNPDTCEIELNWTLADYRRRGLPEISYQADLAHEEFHANNCRRSGPQRYAANMSFPQKRAQEEIGAYNRKIEVLQRWIQEHCSQ